MTRQDNSLPATARDVLDYWIGDADDSADAARKRGSLWFGSSSDTDDEIRRRFGDTMEAVRDGRCEDWLGTAAGTLAQIVVLDQFPRNLYRGTAEAFACDARALELSLSLADTGRLDLLGWMSRAFALMPLQHSEDPSVQERAVQLFETLARDCDTPHREILENSAEYARLHRDIVVRFGRFPHRNRVLGRTSTPEETAWLADGAPTFGQG